MNVTPRLKRILTVMLEQDRVMAVKELAEEVGVSKRTVQREMEGISYFPGYEVTLESKTGKGVWIEGTPEEKKRLLEELKGGDSVKSTFLTDMDKIFQTALTVDEIEGVIINPWNRTIMLNKRLISIILGTADN